MKITESSQNTSPLREAPLPTSTGPSTGRLVGVDLARALAVFGMYIVHIAPISLDQSTPGYWVRFLAEGHSSVLFATLAGFSLMLLAGRFEPKTGLAGRQAKARIAIRAVVLLAIGTAMAVKYGGVIILGFYGVYFLLALPLVRLSAKALAGIALAVALVGPQLLFSLNLLLTQSVRQSINTYDPLHRLSDVGVLDLLFTGFYPALPWMAFVLTGMALGRLDLSDGTVQRRLAALGAGLAVTAYGLSVLLAGADTLFRQAGGGGSSSGGSGSMSFDKDALPERTASDLLTAGSHSGTTFDVVGSIGVAILMIVAATYAMDHLPRLRRFAAPVIAVGTMSLTAYVGHFVGQTLLGMDDAVATQQSWTPVLLFILGAIVFAAIWSRFFRRGPLEHLLNAATGPVKRLR
ncbi:DUF418 domain-containing protein [Streptomyces sp. S6]